MRLCICAYVHALIPTYLGSLNVSWTHEVDAGAHGIDKGFFVNAVKN